MDKVIISKGYNSLTGECSSELDTPPVSQIIDGVDVSGCEHFKINRGFNCYKGYNCTDKECSDCYYKQLKRKEQENERLKEEIKNNKSAYQVELGTYNMECGNLLEENKILQDSFDGQKNAYKQLNKQYKELKSYLQEIKNCLNTLSGIDNDFVNTETYLRILDLITKAEEE